MQKRKALAAESKAKAMALAIRMEQVARLAASGESDRSKLKAQIEEIVEAVTGETLKAESVRKLYENWLERFRLKGANPRTIENYRSRINRLLEWLGPRADRSAEDFKLADAQAFYDDRAKRINPSTLKKEAEVLAMAFSSAVNKGLLPPPSPWAGLDRVKQIRKKGKGARKPFTEEQVARLLRAADPQMAGVIYLQAYAGLRLGDAANLKWASVILKGGGGAGMISFVPDKDSFGDEHHVPLHPDLRGYLQGLKASAKNPDGRLFPKLAGKPIGGNSGLSRMFKRVMSKAKISPEWQEAVGTEGKRVATLTDHSLRYFFNNRMREAGVIMEDRMDITGHEDETIHKGYSAVEIPTLAKKLAQVKALPPPPLVS